MDHIEILSECLIKLENVKEEPEDHAEEEACSLRDESNLCSVKREWQEEDDEEERSRLFPVKRELKEEDEEEDEIKPPIRVFLDPEVSNEEVNQEDQDPLGVCNETVLGEGTWGVGAELGHWKPGMGSAVEMRSRLCNGGGDLPCASAGEEPHGGATHHEDSAQGASHAPNPISTRRIVEGPDCVTRSSESGHEDRVTPKGQGSHECSVCQKSFTRRSRLIEHIRFHTGERPHECSVCQKTFSRRNVLARHLSVHCGERPYECSVCQKTFSRRNGLARHLRIHSGERPYECSLCPKAFTDKSNLITHMWIHSEERPYECSVCQKTFVHTSNLKTHMLTHSGERPYECSVCQKTYIRKIHLKMHMRIHSKQSPNECSVSQKCFV